MCWNGILASAWRMNQESQDGLSNKICIKESRFFLLKHWSKEPPTIKIVGIQAPGLPACPYTRGCSAFPNIVEGLNRGIFPAGPSVIMYDTVGLEVRRKEAIAKPNANDNTWQCRSLIWD
jgi:hypothetical protein